MTGETAYRLSGADAFFLALESRGVHASPHDRYCYYLLQLEGSIDKKSFESELNQKIPFAVNAGKLKGKHGFIRPSWHFPMSAKIEIELRELPASENLMNALKGFIEGSFKDNQLIGFYLIPGAQNETYLCMRWHHLLMDGHGAVLLLKHLLQKNANTPTWFPAHEHTWFRLWPFYKIIRFISNTSHKPIFFPEQRLTLNTPPLFRLLTVKNDEFENLKAKISDFQANAFRSLFYLTMVCKTLDECPWWKGSSDFWVPVPVNARKPGQTGLVFSNQLSFYFFRIFRKQVQDPKSVFHDLRSQMRFQVEKSYPKLYLRLTNFMRFLPLGFFYIFVKGWKRKQHASFMFTMAQPHPNDFLNISGLPVKEALSLPPNTDPPGLTFAVMEGQSHVHLMIQCRENILAEAEMDQLTWHLRQNLLIA